MSYTTSQPAPAVVNWNPINPSLLSSLSCEQLEAHLDRIQPVGETPTSLFATKFFRCTIYFRYLSMVKHSEFRLRGCFESILKVRIIKFVTENTENGKIALTVASSEEFSFDTKLSNFIERIEYLAKGKLGKYLYHLREYPDIEIPCSLVGTGCISYSIYSYCTDNPSWWTFLLYGGLTVTPCVRACCAYHAHED